MTWRLIRHTDRRRDPGWLPHSGAQLIFMASYSPWSIGWLPYRWLQMKAPGMDEVTLEPRKSVPRTLPENFPGKAKEGKNKKPRSPRSAPEQEYKQNWTHSPTPLDCARTCPQVTVPLQMIHSHTGHPPSRKELSSEAAGTVMGSVLWESFEKWMVVA